MRKKGVSAVVATVLLILIGFMAVGLIWGIILPMIKGGLEKGKGCFELREYFKILDSEYTCYTSENTSLMIERSFENYSIKGFAVNIISGSSSTRYNIVNGLISGVKMRDKATNDPQENIEIPNPGEAKTYIFINSPLGQVAEIAVLRDDDSICDAESYNIMDCSEVI